MPPSHVKDLTGNLRLKFPISWLGVFHSHEKFPPIPPCALPQPKHDLTYVLDLGFLFSLMCAIPLRYDLPIHGKLNYGMVLGERLPILLCFFCKLVLHAFLQSTHPTHHCSHDLVVFSFTFCLRIFYQLVSLEHFIASVFNDGLTLRLDSIFNLLLEGRTLRIVLGDVFQPPTTSRCDLSLQDLVGKDVGASNLTRRNHSILEELDFVRFRVRSLYELILVVHSFFCFIFHHHSISNRFQFNSFFFFKSSTGIQMRSFFAYSSMAIHVYPF